MVMDLFLIFDEQIDWLILLCVCVLQFQLIGLKSRVSGWHPPGHHQFRKLVELLTERDL